MSSFSFTIKCEHCSRAAQKVCFHPECQRYPFVCGENKECPLNSSKNELYRLHYHGEDKKTVYLAIDEFRQMLNEMPFRLTEDHIKNIKNWEKKIKSKITNMVHTQTQLLTQKYLPKLYASIQQLKKQATKPSNFPNLQGHQVHSLITQTDIFIKKHDNYKINKNLQYIFNEFMSSIDQTITVFINKYNKYLSLLNESVTKGYQNPEYFLNVSNNIEQIVKIQKQEEEEQIQNEVICLSSGDENELKQVEIKKPKKKGFDKNIKALLNKAEKLFNSSKTKQAIDVLQKGINDGYLNWKIYLKLGDYSFNKSNNPKDYSYLDQLDDYYTKSYILKKENPEGYNGKGTVLSFKYRQTKDQGYLLQAVQYFDEALKHQKSAIYYYNRGKCELDLKKYKNAINSFTLGMKLQTNNIQLAQYFYYRGQCYTAIGQKQNAINDYSKAYELDPNTVDYVNVLKKNKISLVSKNSKNDGHQPRQ